MLLNARGHEVVLVDRQAQPLPWLRRQEAAPFALAPAGATPAEWASRLPRGHQEMLGPWHHFPAEQTLAWLRSLGLPIQSPAASPGAQAETAASALVDLLGRELDRRGIEVRTGHNALEVATRPDGFQVWFEEGEPLIVEALVLATGTGPHRGLALAEAFGHTVQPLSPSLLALKLKDARLRHLQGQPPVEAEVRFADRPGLPADRVERGQVEILGHGIGGPAIANLTAWAAPELAGARYRFPFQINWVPQYGGQIARELSQRALHHTKGVIAEEPQAGLPPKLWARLVEAAKIGPQETWGSVDKRYLSTLVGQLTQGRFSANGYAMHKPEHTYAGGVSRDEIDFRTMGSRKHGRLYFAGELVDCDAILGGGNALLALTHAQIIAATAEQKG